MAAIEASSLLESSPARQNTQKQAALLLAKQLQDLRRNPVEGFSAGLIDEADIFQWQLLIMGPEDTP